MAERMRRAGGEEHARVATLRVRMAHGAKEGRARVRGHPPGAAIQKCCSLGRGESGMPETRAVGGSELHSNGVIKHEFVGVMARPGRRDAGNTHAQIVAGAPPSPLIRSLRKWASPA